MVLFCNVGKHRWHWDGKPIVLPAIQVESFEDIEHKNSVYRPEPRRIGLCECPFCRRQKHVRILPPNAGSSPEEPSPWQENAVRALEDA